MKINWKKFWKYELYSFIVVSILYVISVFNDNNIFPKHIIVIIIIPVLFGMMMIIKARHDKLITKCDYGYKR